MSQFLADVQAVSDRHGQLFMVELTAPSFSGPAYLVSDTQDWTSNGRVYVGVPFGFRKPDDVAGQSPRLELVLSNAGRGWSEELERLGPNETVMAKFMIASRRNPDQIEREWNVRIAIASISGGEVRASGGLDHLLRQQAVRLRANGFTTPGLF